MIQWLNTNQGFVMVILTAFYVIFTGWIIWEMRKDRKERSQPNVIVDFFPKRISGAYVIDLVIKNIGNGVAKNISISFDQKITDVHERELNKLGFIKNLSFLSPGRELSHFVDISFKYFEKGKPSSVTGKATYENIHGKKFTSIIACDLQAFKNLVLHPPRKDIEDLIKEGMSIKNIERIDTIKTVEKADVRITERDTQEHHGE